MRIIPIPVRSDNYAYLLVNSSGQAAAIDPYDPKKVIAAAEAQNVKLGEWLLTTHHHQDHSGGNLEFKDLYPQVKVVGGSEQCSGLTNKMHDGDCFTIGTDLEIKCVATPCHTQDSICYFVTDKSSGDKALFTGDTLFISGCGRFFEGTAQEMHTALNQKLARLPDSTVVYPGHEYTKSNVAFSFSVEPQNPHIKVLKEFCEKESVTTGKFTIGDEKKHNVFMRLDQPAVTKAAKTNGEGDEVATMEKLREMKNNFRG